MVTWRIVDDDVECLHVERNPIMTCSGSHLYEFYRFLRILIQHSSMWIKLNRSLTPGLSHTCMSSASPYTIHQSDALTEKTLVWLLGYRWGPKIG
jgi:hypothetical protein